MPNDYSAEQFLQLSALFHSKGWLAVQSDSLPVIDGLVYTGL